MVKLKQLITEDNRKKAEQAFKKMKKFAKIYGFKEVDAREAMRYEKELVDDGFVGGFIKGREDYVFVYDDGWVNWSSGNASGNDEIRHWSTMEGWNSQFGLGNRYLVDSINDIDGFMEQNPQIFSKYLKGEDYINVPVKLLEKFGLPRKYLESIVSDANFQYDHLEVELENGKLSIKYE